MARRNIDLCDGPFVTHSLKMRQSFAWRSLSNMGRRILDRLEVEHMTHGGAENGNLVCTYDDFYKAGIWRERIPSAIQECVALGFLEVTLHGGLTISDIKRPSRYRLTYLVGRGKSPDPTHDWRRIKAPKLADGEAKPKRDKIFSPVRHTVLQVGVRHTVLQPGTAYRTAVPVRYAVLPSISREGVPISKGGRNGCPPPPPQAWHKPVIVELSPKEAAAARERLKDVRSWHEEHGRT
jgi:hypothetical protein